MYIPAFNEEQHLPTLFSLIARHPLGMWTTLVNGEIEINHIPFMLNEKQRSLWDAGRACGPGQPGLAPV